MSDVSLYEKVSALVDTYNTMLKEYGIKVALHRRSFTEEVRSYSEYGQHSFLNLLEYVLINKKIEEKKYHHVPNRYKLLVLQVEPISKHTADNNFKQYAFWVYQFARAYQGQKPTEWQHKERSVILKIEKRLRKLQKQAKKIQFCRMVL